MQLGQPQDEDFGLGQANKWIYKEDAGCTLSKDDAGSTYIAGKLKRS
jgi:hypothetical protein